MSEIESETAAPSSGASESNSKSNVPVVTLLDTTVEGLASRPDSLKIDVITSNDDNDAPPADGSGYNKERRGSKSCLKVTNHDGPKGGGDGDTPVPSPIRRRSVHWDSSPAATVEVPASKDEKEQRGCGSLKGPAPYAGKEVFVKPPENLPAEDDQSDADEEEEQRLALAQAIARRQSAPCSMIGLGGGGAGCKPRPFSPPATLSESPTTSTTTANNGAKPRLHSPPPPAPPPDDEEEEEEEEPANKELEGKDPAHITTTITTPSEKVTSTTAPTSPTTTTTTTAKNSAFNSCNSSAHQVTTT